jgi:hypothetical protein
MQVKTYKLAVVGTEEVTVPAGTFTTHKVSITSAEGEPGSRTLWVATDGSSPDGEDGSRRASDEWGGTYLRAAIGCSGSQKTNVINTRHPESPSMGNSGCFVLG